MNFVYNLRNIVTQPDKSQKKTGDREGTFLSVASFASFPAVTALMSGIWKLMMVLGPKIEFFKSNLVPLILAFLIGAFLLYMDLSDPERKIPLSNRQKIIKSVIAIFNSLMLTAAVLGIDVIVQFSQP